jgi:GntR family transcriptional regulator, transcriptional repressor for pyruvate dehydrogenase complex
MTPTNGGIEPVKQLRLSDAVAAQLEALISSGHFGDEGRLPSERDLADSFEVGRGTMREAIRKLETMGIIARSHGVGTFVAANGNAPSTQIDLLTVGDATALELFEVRYAIEPIAAAASAHRRTAQDLRDLGAILDRAGREDVSDEEFVQLDFEFHSQLVASSKNRVMLALYQQIEKYHGIYSAKVIGLPQRRQHAHEGHLLILRAVEDRKPSQSKKAALDHLRYAEKDLVNAVEEFDPPKR